MTDLGSHLSRDWTDTTPVEHKPIHVGEQLSDHRERSGEQLSRYEVFHVTVNANADVTSFADHVSADSTATMCEDQNRLA
jgi:hypothetical protein